MKLFLHIGNHRTGSTSIQEELFAHSSELLKLGILYPASLMKDSAHHKLFYSLMVKNNEHLYITNDEFNHGLSILKSEIKTSGCDLVVISSEEFMNVQIIDETRMLRFLDLFDSFVVVCYMQHQTFHFESSYKHSVLWTEHQYSSDFDSYVNHQLSSEFHEYIHLVKYFPKYASFCNYEFRNFYNLSRDRKVVKEFFNIIGAGSIDCLELIKNSGLSPKGTLILTQINSEIKKGAVFNRDLAVDVISMVYPKNPLTKQTMYNKKLFLQVIFNYYHSNIYISNELGFNLNDSLSEFYSIASFLGYSLNDEDLDFVNYLLRWLNSG